MTLFILVASSLPHYQFHVYVFVAGTFEAWNTLIGPLLFDVFQKISVPVQGGPRLLALITTLGHDIRLMLVLRILMRSSSQSW